MISVFRFDGVSKFFCKCSSPAGKKLVKRPNRYADHGRQGQGQTETGGPPGVLVTVVLERGVTDHQKQHDAQCDNWGENQPAPFKEFVG